MWVLVGLTTSDWNKEKTNKTKQTKIKLTSKLKKANNNISTICTTRLPFELVQLILQFSLADVSQFWHLQHHGVSKAIQALPSHFHTVGSQAFLWGHIAWSQWLSQTMEEKSTPNPPPCTPATLPIFHLPCISDRYHVMALPTMSASLAWIVTPPHGVYILGVDKSCGLCFKIMWVGSFPKGLFTALSNAWWPTSL